MSMKGLILKNLSGEYPSPEQLEEPAEFSHLSQRPVALAKMSAFLMPRTKGPKPENRPSDMDFAEMLSGQADEDARERVARWLNWHPEDMAVFLQTTQQLADEREE